MTTREAAIDAMLAKQAIQEVLVRYAHGVDRCDVPVIKSAYWPDGTDDHGTFTGNAMEFADYLGKSLKQFNSITHFLGNVMIELDGDNARVQSYVTAHHDIPIAKGSAAMVLGGRYLDRFQRRNGEWRILDRIFVTDWGKLDPEASHMAKVFDLLKLRGDHSPNDPWDKGLPKKR